MSLVSYRKMPEFHSDFPIDCTAMAGSKKGSSKTQLERIAYMNEACASSMTSLFFLSDFLSDSLASQIREYRSFYGRCTYVRPNIIRKPLELACQETCECLIKTISDTVDRTINHVDYSGLVDYFKFLQAIEKREFSSDWKLDFNKDGTGTACVGMSHAIVDSLKKEHGIEGTLVFQRIDSRHAFDHAAVMVKCSDGVVLIDPSSDPSNRLFSIPFEEMTKFKNFFAQAVGDESGVVLRGKYHERKVERSDPYEKDESFEYCQAGDGGHSVMMYYMSSHVFSKPVAIVTYDPQTGKPIKAIKVFFDRQIIILKDFEKNVDGSKKREIVIPFKKLMEQKSVLDEFMQTGFKSSSDVVYEHISTIASSIDLVREIFSRILYTKPWELN